MDLVVLIIFGLVYLGLMLGRLPGLALDRTGLALLGALALLVSGRVSLDQARTAVDLPTMVLLFGLMVISAQFRLGGFYSRVVRWISERRGSPEHLLGLLILVVGLLSSVLANDVVCLAVTPVLVEGCARRGLNPKPFLLALACAANVGSAATLIGNPQNMLIGQVLRLPFGQYLLEAGVPAGLGLLVTWAILVRQYSGRWEMRLAVPEVAAPEFNAWQSVKGLAVLTGLILAFLLAPWPREVMALAAAGLLLCSRRMRSREMLGLVDWQLLVLFIALFVINKTLADSGALSHLTGSVRSWGLPLEAPAWLFGVSAVLSNLISNVPAVMLLLPSAGHPLAGPILALSSTLAGNLIVVGSIANIIVMDQAARLGINITWAEHARTGVPVTLATLALTGLWLFLRLG